MLASVVAISACKKDDKPDAAAEGTKAAKEVCNCFKKPLAQMEDCIEDVFDKYEKYDDNTAFETAFEKQLEKCDADDWDIWWDLITDGY